MCQSSSFDVLKLKCACRFLSCVRSPISPFKACNGQLGSTRSMGICLTKSLKTKALCSRQGGSSSHFAVCDYLYTGTYMYPCSGRCFHGPHVAVLPRQHRCLLNKRRVCHRLLFSMLSVIPELFSVSDVEAE